MIIFKILNKLRVWNNPDLRVCEICGRVIDLTLAIDDEHGYVRYPSRETYFHLPCWAEKQKELIK